MTRPSISGRLDCWSSWMTIVVYTAVTTPMGNAAATHHQ
jgi:hypothetical protein